MPDHPPIERVGFVASPTTAARRAKSTLVRRYGDAPIEEADVIVALGGDGLMLQTLHRVLGRATPIYGMNRGSVGFLMNEFGEDRLMERVRAARPTVIHPLRMTAVDGDGAPGQSYAINEVSLLRAGAQTAKLRIRIDGLVRMDALFCDGIIIATPAGSTAYNLSANGPILPLEASLLAVTPISAFRPRRWRGAILPERAQISIEMLEPIKRPVNAVADNSEVKSVHRVDVTVAESIDLVMLHDPGHSLDERILKEQFEW